MHRIFGWVCVGTMVLACGQPIDTTGGSPGRGGKADGVDSSGWLVEDEAYRYEVAAGVYMGQHSVLDPRSSVLGDGREAMDTKNQPTKLHPDLKGSYAKYNAEMVAGEAEWNVFPSNWWPQSKNGSAWRWTKNSQEEKAYEDFESDKDALSPSEKYDLLFYANWPASKRTVAARTNKVYGDDEAEEVEHPELVVAGPATKWELENHGNWQNHMPESWWGHCNGWASYATTDPGGAPQCDVRVKYENNEVKACAIDDASCTLFRMGDIEALMTELYFSDSSTFVGRRCRKKEDDIEKDQCGRPVDEACRDINPGTFHIAITGMMGEGVRPLSGGDVKKKVPFVIDHTYHYEVWNFPLKKFTIDEQEMITREQAATLTAHTSGVTDVENCLFNENATKFVRIKATYWMVSDGVNQTEMLKQADTRDIDLDDVALHYILELGPLPPSQGGGYEILGGEWIHRPSTTWGTDSKKLHPDFLWAGVRHNSHPYYENNDDLANDLNNPPTDGDNPFIAYSKVRAILDLANDPAVCNPTTTEPVENETLLAVEGEEVARGAEKTYTVDVAAGASKLTITLTPASGDPDLTVAGNNQTLSSQEYNLELDKVEYDNPAAGTYTIVVKGYKESTYSLKVVVVAGSGGTVDPEPDPQPTAGVCDGSCGSASPVGPNSCYCDAACTGYNDCCQADGSQDRDTAYLAEACPSVSFE
jgi:hypothetical protein